VASAFVLTLTITLVAVVLHLLFTHLANEED